MRGLSSTGRLLRSPLGSLQNSQALNNGSDYQSMVSPAPSEAAAVSLDAVRLSDPSALPPARQSRRDGFNRMRSLSTTGTLFDFPRNFDQWREHDGAAAVLDAAAGMGMRPSGARED